MNATNPSLIFPEQVISKHPQGGTTFHDVAPPADPRAAEAFYQGLPSVGWSLRSVCRQRPAADRDQVFKLGLEALREHAEELSAVAPEDFERRALEKIQGRLTARFGEMSWPQPLPPAPEPEVPDDAKVPPAQPIVMVAEDCPVTRFSICMQLRRAGLKPLIVTSGVEALVMAAVVQPDMILMDVLMSPLDGVRACRYLKRSRLVNPMPVIFLSGSEERELIMAGYEAGGADYIIKPFDSREGLVRIRTHLEKRKLQRQLEMANRQLRRALTASSTAGQLESNKTPASAGLTRSEDTLKLDCVPLDLAPMLQLASWIYSHAAKQKEIDLQLDAPKDGLMVFGDEVRLQRVVESFLSNAIRFSPENSTVVLAARQEAGLLRVWVDDAGPGVRLSEQSRIFVPRNPEAEDAAGQGDGSLKLSDCRRVVQAHHGLITMHNKVPHGAHFEIYLPTLSERQRAEKDGELGGPTEEAAGLTGVAENVPLHAKVA
jgi:DNA-binding response OmpR family regulator